MRRSTLLTTVLLALGTSSYAHTQQPRSTRAGGTMAATVGRIEIADLEFGAYVGSTLDMAAAVWGQGTSTATDSAAMRWASSDVLTAWITEEGTLTLFKPGRVTLTVTKGSLKASKEIEIVPNPARKLNLSGDAQAEVRVGTPIRLHTQVLDDDGRVIDDARVNYAVAAGDLLRNPNAARITDDGVFTAEEPGVYVVVAEFGGVADHLTMLIGRPGVTTEPAAADVRDVEIDDVRYQAFVGTALPLTARVTRRGVTEPMVRPRLHWESSNDDVAWVAPNGVVVFESPGKVTITVAHGTRKASRTFTVNRNPAARLVLGTNAREVYVADTVQLRTEVWARGAQMVRDPRVHYAVISRSPGTAGAATVLEDGSFVATKPGVYTVVAEFGGLADTRTIMVLPRSMDERRGSR